MYWKYRVWDWTIKNIKNKIKYSSKYIDQTDILLLLLLTWVKLQVFEHPPQNNESNIVE